MIYPNKPLYLLSLLGYIYYLTYYTLTTKDNTTKAACFLKVPTLKKREWEIILLKENISELEEILYANDIFRHFDFD